jgi:hypothetical protein
LNGQRSYQTDLVSWISSVRSIVETQEFERQRLVVMPDIQRFDEIMRGVYWALATRPEAFPAVGHDSNIHVLKTDEFTGVPRLRIFYRFDESTVHLLWIEML